MPAFRHALLTASILCVLLLSACASTPGPAAGADRAEAFEPLYAQIALQSELFETAQEAMRHGDAALGGEQRDRALAALHDAAMQCTALPGCDAARFIDAYAALLARRDAAPDDDESAAAGQDEGMAQVPAASPLVDDLPEAGRSLDLLNGRDLRELIAFNPQLKAALNEWLTWMRPQLLDSWDNYQHMRHRMWPEYERAGLPEALLFGILAKESGGRVHAVSRAGASGPLQFMPATGRRFGLGRRDDGFDTRFDPALSTRANVAYLNERFAEFNADLALALAAYNGGEGRVGRLYRQSGGRSFWSSEVQGQLPAETRDYVPMVLAAAWLFLHPQQYGLDFRHDSAPAELALHHPASLNALAICLGGEGTRSGWFRTLRNLNPQYDPQQVLAEGTRLDAPQSLVDAYQQHCQDGPRVALAAEISQARVAQPRVVSAARHVVRRGDTLAGIARRYGCGSPAALARANNIAPPRYLIRPGQSLSLQGCRG